MPQQRRFNMWIRYRWMHIPTGQTGTRQVFFNSWQDCADKIAKWNTQGGQLWKYWADVTIGG